MARRKGKKVKQMIREDSFRDAVLSLGRRVKKNAFYIAVLTAAVVLFSYALYRRLSHYFRTQETLMRILTTPSEQKLPSKRYRELLKEYEGKEVEPLIRLYLARALLEEHNERCVKTADKGLLKEAAAQLKTILERFPNAHTARFYASKLLPLVEKELKAEYTWVKKEQKRQEKR